MATTRSYASHLGSWLAAGALALCALARPARADPDPGVLQLPMGHGQTTTFQLRGRLVEDKHAGTPQIGASRLRNLIDTTRQLRSEEIEGALIEVRIGAHRLGATTDEEGMFSVQPEGLSPPLTPGRQIAEVVVMDARGHPTPSARVPVLILPDTPGVAIISDVDDTIVVTGVRSTRRMLKLVLTRNAAQVEAVPGVGAAYRAAVAAGAVAVFYVSGSPQNFLPRIEHFIRRERLPMGPVFLKDFGSDGLFDQATYKISRIQGLLALHPQLRFVLVGDSGEHDPEIYARIRGQFPDRIVAIVIRKVPGLAPDPARLAGMTVVSDFAHPPHGLSMIVGAALAP